MAISDVLDIVLAVLSGGTWLGLAVTQRRSAAAPPWPAIVAVWFAVLALYNVLALNVASAVVDAAATVWAAHLVWTTRHPAAASARGSRTVSQL